MATYGLTDSGFTAKTLQVIMEELRSDFKSAFGSDIDVSDESVAGLYIGNQAAKLTQLWEQLELLWNTGDADNASGIFLDRLYGYLGIVRIGAKKTRTPVALYGTLTTAIPAGHKIRKTVSHELMTIRYPVTIDWSVLLAISFQVNTVVASHDYDLYINSTLVRYSSGIGESASTIQQGILNRIAVLFPGIFTGINGTTVELRTTDGNTAFTLASVDSNITITRQATRAEYDADDYGEVYVPSETLTEIVTVISGLNSCINYAAGVTGREAMQDAEFRTYARTAQIRSSANEWALTAAVQALDGVEYTRTFSNRTNGVVSGRPAKSYEVLVQGGQVFDIAQAIFNAGPAGIEPYGTITQTVYDSQGTAWAIKFSRPTVRYIWIQAVVTRFSEETFPVDGPDQLRNAWTDYAVSVQDIGIDVIYQRYIGTSYRVPGIASVDFQVAVTSDLTPPVTYAAINIPIGETEIALFDTSRINLSVI